MRNPKNYHKSVDSEVKDDNTVPLSLPFYVWQSWWIAESFCKRITVDF